MRLHHAELGRVPWNKQAGSSNHLARAAISHRASLRAASPMSPRHGRNPSEEVTHGLEELKDHVAMHSSAQAMTRCHRRRGEEEAHIGGSKTRRPPPPPRPVMFALRSGGDENDSEVSAALREAIGEQGAD